MFCKVTSRLPVSSEYKGFSNKLLSNNFYYALVYIFNRVSTSRIKVVGPDRACAEWLMRNGARIRWKHETGYVANYNSLPLDDKVQGDYAIKEVDATDAAISHHGFPYFHNCNHVDGITLVNCWYIEDKALSKLQILKNSLLSLEIRECTDVTDKGLKTLDQLVNLKSLKLGSLKSVNDLQGVVNGLKNSLPNTEITIVK